MNCTKMNKLHNNAIINAIFKTISTNSRIYKHLDILFDAINKQYRNIFITI